MEIISSQDFYTMYHRSDFKILATTLDGRPKVFEAPHGEVIKIYYPKKRRISSSKYKPYAFRFIKNAKRLNQLGVAAPIIYKMQHCAELNIYLIFYKKLPGEDALILANQGERDITQKVASFVAILHQKGVFFRAIHLSNLLYQPNGEFALLDISDVRFKKRALSLYLRYRNLKHLLLHHTDKEAWRCFGLEEFLKIYAQNLNIIAKKLVAFFVRRIFAGLVVKNQPLPLGER